MGFGGCNYRCPFGSRNADDIFLAADATKEILQPATYNFVEVPFEDTIISIVWEPERFIENPMGFEDEISIATLVFGAATQKSRKLAERTFERLGFSTYQSYSYDEFNINRPSMTIGGQWIYTNKGRKYLVVASIRGTTSLGDKISDGIAFLISRGLEDIAKFEYERLSKFVSYSDADPEDMFFIISGHSLGGGTAQALVQMCGNNYRKENDLVYTFAPLRTNEKFIDSTDNIHSIINSSDHVLLKSFKIAR